MESELHLVQSVREAKDGEVGALDHGDSFITLAIILLTLIVGGDGDEMSQLLSSQEILQKNALVHLMVERDFIESLLEVPSEQFVVNERLLGQEMQVLLEWFTDKVVT